MSIAWIRIGTTIPPGGSMRKIRGILKRAYVISDHSLECFKLFLAKHK